jgi:hypothetical protein
MVKNETEEKLEKIRIGSQYKIDIFSASLTKTS